MSHDSTNDSGSLDKTDRRNQSSYTNEAAQYDRIRWSTPRRRYYVELSNQVIGDLIGLKDGLQVLDVATGTGRISLHLARRGAQVIGVDLTAAMLEEAREKAKAENLSNLTLVVANARALPYPDGTFDAVTAIRFFHLLPFELQREILAELYRVVKPGGRVVVEFNNKFSGVFLRPILDIHARYTLGFWGGRFWPHQHARTFAGYPVRRKRGVWFLGQGHFWQLSPKLAAFVDRLAGVWPFHLFTEQLLVVIEKPAAQGRNG